MILYYNTMPPPRRSIQFFLEKNSTVNIAVDEKLTASFAHLKYCFCCVALDVVAIDDDLNHAVPNLKHSHCSRLHYACAPTPPCLISIVTPEMGTSYIFVRITFCKTDILLYGCFVIRRSVIRMFRNTDV